MHQVDVQNLCVGLLVAFGIVVAGSEATRGAKLAEWKAEYRRGGGGLVLESPDGYFRFRQLGYLQVRADVYHPDFERPDEGVTFGLRRARLDWIVDVEDVYELLIEVDGADFNAPNQSDFDLVVAKISGPAYGGGRWFVGKFITPFSTENNRSSRSLDMAERYLALNSLFLLPALDVQFGGMVEQPLGENWTGYAGIFNGNGRAADNLSDNNDDKEFQLKLRHRPSESFTWSLAYDRSTEEPQTLSLEGYSFTNYSSVAVNGTRRILGGSFDYTEEGFSFRGEGLYADFADVDATLAGGYLQPAYFPQGDRTEGLQLLLRADYASVEKDGVSLPGDAIGALTLGANWYLNGNVRVRANAVGEYYPDPGNNVTPASGVQGDGLKPYLLFELQMKF